MPYLTSAGGRLSATGADRLGLGVPGYAHPLLARAEWAGLTRPGTPLHWAVLNVANGPGARPDPHCLEAAGRLGNAGVRVLGHLDLAYGERSFGEIVAEAHDYVDWYRVGGFYLDRCPATGSDLTDVRLTTATLEVVSGGGHIVLGHGTHPHPGYAGVADQLVTFSGPWDRYRWSQAAEWTADHPPERFVHLVHGVPRTHLDEAMRIARWQGAGTIFFTDRRERTGDGAGDRTGEHNPFETLPGYWDEIVSRVGPGVLE
ncbi:spherulation-specific family 4 protein [Streptomyces liangshanensis]|uniref:Phage tail protein n=1 Tax=Streptomyces liangshanensis TaxID=2717324 RepID=A0A6G9GXS9_9ACTN|nr:spherulation-specific family 4 protein [Streptomyces liangshanensis]QIQ02801.1 phage tail protein [Streptomyces liangshanensis]